MRRFAGIELMGSGQFVIDEGKAGKHRGKVLRAAS
jgi:hypothetical protein